MSAPDENPAQDAYRRTQKRLFPLIAVGVPVVFVLAHGARLILLPIALLISLAYVTAVFGGGRAIANVWRQSRRR